MRAPWRCKHVIFVVALVGAAVIPMTATPAYASAIQVTTTADDLNVDENCTLREAIQAANTDSAIDACPAGSGADIIGLPAGTYTLSIFGQDEDADVTGDLDISSDLTITGAGSEVTIIDGNDLDRVLHVVAGTVDVSGVTVQNGWGVCRGAGIYNDGTLTLNDAVITRNDTACSGGGGWLGGGGIFNVGALTVNDSSVRDNFMGDGGAGGGILSLGSLTVRGSSISDHARSNPIYGWAFDGGGLLIDGSAILEDTIVSGNAVWDRGGGIYIAGGTVTLTNVTVSGNYSHYEPGGGIYVWGTATLSSVTVSGNYSASGVGGIYMTASATVIVGNTIVANSTSGEADCESSTLTSQGHNLIETTGCIIGGPQAGDLEGVDPLLGALADNGGPTLTQALLTGSPAIDAGNPACPPPATDQRGVARPQGAGCDIGAFELEITSQDVTPPTVTVTAPTPPTGQDGYFNAADLQAGGGHISVGVSAEDPSGVADLTCSDNDSPVDVEGQSGSDPRMGTVVLSADGIHDIACTATDGVSNVGASPESANTATVKIDSRAPEIALPAPFSVNATAPSGATVTYEAHATDEPAGDVPVSCSPPSASVFPIGDTDIGCNAADPAGNGAGAQTRVHVKGALEQLDDLMAAVDASSIKRATKAVLLRTLQSARRSLVRGRTAPAYLALEVFVIEVRVYQGLGRIPEPLSSSWIGSARQIEAVMGYA